MKKYMFSLVLLLMNLPLFVSAKNLTAVQYIEKIASDNNADKTSINAIGNTGLAYDGTLDNNLRYIGVNPNNYVDIGDVYKTDIYKGIQSRNKYRYYSSYEECISNKFYGDNPNYLNTGCEKVHSKGDKILWRIIGVMNNINSHGQKETKIKLVRAESIGFYFIDSTPPSINGGIGISEWEQSDLNRLLNNGYDNNQEEQYKQLASGQYEFVKNEIVNNSLYWNSKKGMCIEPNYNAATNLCDFTGTGLTETSKKFVDTVIWDTGTYVEQKYGDIMCKPGDLYSWERSKERHKNMTIAGDEANDEVERTAIWEGKVGIVYLSDFALATGGGSTTSREECLNKSMLHINEYPSWSTAHDCQDNSWLKTDSWQEATMTLDDQNGISSAFIYESNYDIFTTWIANGGNVHPTFYLNNNSIIVSGDGTQNNPYKLALEENKSVELKVSSKKELNEIFNNIGNDIDWIIKDKSILEIKNNTIVPLKVGVTEVTGEKDNTIYNLRVIITDDLFINPSTNASISIIILIIVLIVCFTSYYSIKNDKRKTF